MGGGGEAGGERRPIRVLLVDDDPSVRNMVKIVLSLEEGDFEVIGEAGDGDAAVEAVRRDPPDVVLLDLEMPGANGLDALPRLRDAAPSARIAVLSAFPDPFTLTDALSHGADTYLDKATGLGELPTILRTLVAPDGEDPQTSDDA